MRIRTLLVVALSLTGCKKDKDKAAAPVTASPQAPASTAEQDALWKLAPEGTVAGVVVSSRGVAAIEGGWLAIKKLFASAPELAKPAAKMNEELTKVFGRSDVRLADVGLAPGKGGAIFGLDGGDELVIIPLADRAKFLQVTKGTQGADADTIGDHTCKTVKGVYACAKPAALLDKVGTAPLGDRLKLAGARGDIEVVAAIPARGSAAPIQLAAVAQVDRGAVVVRGAIQGAPSIVTEKLVASGAPSIDPAKAAGFAIMNLGPVLASAPIPPAEIVPGVSAAELASNVAGPVTARIPPGGMVFDVRVPMKDTAPAQKLVEQCDSIPPLAMAGAKVEKGVCHVEVPQLAMALDAWVEGKELRIGTKGASAGATLAPTAIASELAKGEWAFAMFGRGTLLGEGQFPSLPIGQLPEEAEMGIRMMMLVNEVGLGVRADGDTVRFLADVRTVWANPDDVVAKLMAISPEQVAKGQAAATAKQIAAASPTAPFAADFKAGLGGVMIPAATIGVLAAVAIPAFLQYQMKAKRPEAVLQLKRLERNIKLAHATNGALPKGKVELTPAASCCESNGTCNDPAVWKDPVWQALDFSIDDPHRFRYAYESTGKTFTAKAVADLDCDGTEIQYTMVGTVDAQGEIQTTLVEPDPGTD